MGWVKKIKKAAKKVTKQATGLVKNVVSSPVNAVSSVSHAVGDVVHDTGKAVGKAVNQTVKVADKVVDKGVEIGKNIVNSPIKTVSSLAKGDIIGAATNLANTASMGTVDLTGRKQGIVNMDTKATIAKQIQRMTGKPSTTQSSAPITATSVKSVLTKPTRKALRQGKGLIGGGSYSLTVKNPLGGASGKTGA